MGDSPFRKDALRQRAAAVALRGCLCAHGRAALRRNGARDGRLGAARNAEPGRRLLLQSRRRLGTRRRQVLRLGARGSRAAPGAGRIRRACDFIRARLWRDGKLLATYNQGQARLNAYLDDHAFLLAACLELAQTDLREDDLHFAQALADSLLARFDDTERSGFYFTSHD